MAIDWIKPKGKTQADIDAGRATTERQETSEVAKKVLTDTREDVLAAIEEYLHDRGFEDARLHFDERTAARSALENHLEVKT